MEVFAHALRAEVDAEKDQLDSQALSDAITYATELELQFLDHGLRLARGSEAGLEIVARKLDLMSRTNNSRIARTWR